MNHPQAPATAAEPAYNLLDEPWLPVRWLHGGTGNIGLAELFARSHEIASLAGHSPPAFVALHRMLLAITHRALTLHHGRWSDGDRARWFRQGLPAEAFNRYFAQWRERFWLFHPTQPFMQVAALAGAPQTQATKPWTQVSLSSATGNNPVMFDHSVDGAPSSVSPAQALSSLLGYLQFVPGGPVKVLHGHDKKGPLFDSAAILPVAATLTQTLLLTLHPAPTSEDLADDDRPAWEKAPPDVADLMADATLARGPNDRYTRLTRATLLLRDEPAGQVSRLRFAEGLGLLDDDHSADPMNSFRQSEDKRVRLRFAEGRTAWRDLPALLPSPAGAAWRPAAVLSWAQNLLMAAGAHDDDVQVIVAGMAANQGKMLQARVEHFRLPPGVMSAADTATELRTQLQRAEDLHTGLRQLAARVTALASPDASSKDTRKRSREVVDAGPLTATFFARTERGLAPLLRAVAGGDTDSAQASWSATLLDAARAAWATTCDMLGQTAAALRARALSDSHFLTLIHPLRPAPSAVADTEATVPQESPA